jgi:hypothetical protein
MLLGRKIYADTFCEVHDLLRPWLDGEYWDFESEPVRSGSIYLVGRQQTLLNTHKFRDMAERHDCVMVLSNPHEGSNTMALQIRSMGLEDLAQQGKMLIVGGGNMDPDWPCLHYDSFLARMFDYPDNRAAVETIDSIFTKTHKPYDFLFLNGAARPHRRWLIDHLKHAGLLDRALWTNLDSAAGDLQFLPDQYELEQYRCNLVAAAQHTGFVKNVLFSEQWGEVYIHPPLYHDSYFSVVTETIFDYPYSFRTEKMAKVLAMGHPWIAVSNQGFYRDLRDLGFQTFDHMIDESFDSIGDGETRLSMILQQITDLCHTNLDAFLAAAEPVCKYNQQHLRSLAPQLRKQFASRFFNFILAHTHG